MNFAAVRNLILNTVAGRPRLLDSSVLAFFMLTEPARMRAPVEEPPPGILRRISSSSPEVAPGPPDVVVTRRQRRPVTVQRWV